LLDDDIRALVVAQTLIGVLTVSAWLLRSVRDAGY
jgi:hypothetical protein